MNRTLKKCGALIATVLAAGATTIVTAGPAHADNLPSGQIPITAGGSDTSEGIMNDVTNDLNHFADPFGALTGFPISGVAGYDHAIAYNIPAFSSTTFHVPGFPGNANDCTAGIDWTKDPLAPAATTAATQGIAPFGSGAGKSYLINETDDTGPNPASGTTPTGTNFSCISVGRSSSPKAGTDPTTFQFIAYALDGVGWATTSTKAPSSLSLDQIKKIYNCTFTDWSQVGGSPGSIVRYFPQAGSGTRNFSRDFFLAGTTPNNSGACSGGGDRNLREIEENQINGKGNGQETFGIKAADLDKAIQFYSGALMVYQKTNAINPTINLSCVVGVCIRMGAIHTDTAFTCTGTACSGDLAAAPGARNPLRWDGSARQYKLDSANVNEANEDGHGSACGSPCFPGVRYIYNILDRKTTRAAYNASKQLYGFDNVPSGAKSPLCDTSALGHDGQGTDVYARIFADILSKGFLTLGTGEPSFAAGSNQAGSTCRNLGPDTN